MTLQHRLSDADRCGHEAVEERMLELQQRKKVPPWPCCPPRRRPRPAPDASDIERVFEALG
jgi:hypothetical protein